MPTPEHFHVCVFCLLLCLTPAVAQDSNDDGLLHPEEAAGSMIVPDGFNVTLFAGEPDVKQPIAFCIDDQGRLWVAEAYNYPHHGTKAGDRIIILEDTDHDGRHDKRTVFYDKLNYVSGIEVGFGGVWVMSPPYFYFIPDRDGDDRPDAEPQLLLDGFGNHSNAHNIANGFAWGPDGWLYGTHGRTNWSMIGNPGSPNGDRVRFDGGVYRYHPVRRIWESYADGTTNPWGIDWDDYGQSFICNCVNPHLFHVIPGAHYEPWRNRKSSEFAFERIPTIADHLHFTGTGNVRDGIGSTAEDAAGGGHAHCGTMVYLGDNWPDRYRNTLFTNNIHGRRINNDILKRKGSGYVASHGPDVMQSQDPWFMGVTLAYGPDGSVFVSDWSDTGECHSVRNTRRHTGRIYRIAYGTPERRSSDVSEYSSSELVQLQTHRNDWFVRHARRVLQERAASGEDMSSVHELLRAMLEHSADVPRRLRCLWVLHVTGGMNRTDLRRLLDDTSEHVRVWAIQLLVENQSRRRQKTTLLVRDTATISRLDSDTLKKFHEMAAHDESSLVRLYLASALQRIPLEQRWTIAEALLAHAEDADDASLPLMCWYAVEPLVQDDLHRFSGLTTTSRIPLVRNHVARRIAGLPQASGGLALLASILARVEDAAIQHDMVAGMLRGLSGRRKAQMPVAWSNAYSQLRSSSDGQVREMANRLAVLFDDQNAIRQLRDQVDDKSVPAVDRRRAIATLVSIQHNGLANVLLKLVTDQDVQLSAINGLAEYEHPETATILLRAYKSMSPAARSSAVQTLASRIGWAGRLLDAVGAKDVSRSDISAYTARQIRNLSDEKLTARLTKIWGDVRATPKDRARQIDAYRKRLTSDELSNADLTAGQAAFQKLCANCHRLFDTGRQVGPDLTGAQRNSLDYLLENLIDPNAQIARDYQMEIIVTESGRTVTGLVKSETDAAVTVATLNSDVVIPTGEITIRKNSDVSLMPEGQLKTLTYEQTRDLIGFLQSVGPASGHDTPVP